MEHLNIEEGQNVVIATPPLVAYYFYLFYNLVYHIHIFFPSITFHAGNMFFKQSVSPTHLLFTSKQRLKYRKRAEYL